jgi:hypothetical protein
MRPQGSRITHIRRYLRAWPGFLSLFPGKWASLLHAPAGRLETGGDIFFLPLTGDQPVSSTAIRERFRHEGDRMPVPCSWCCIGNFQGHPGVRVIRLPAGMGPGLRSDMEEFIGKARSSLRGSFLSEDYRQQVASLRAACSRQEKIVARRLYLALAKAPRQRPPEMNPGEGAHADLSTAGKGALERLRGADCSLLGEWMRSIKKRCTDEIEACTSRRAIQAVRPLMFPLRRKYREIPEVLVYLEEVEEDLLRNLHLFTLPEGKGPREGVFSPYEVEVLAAGAPENERPVVFVHPGASREDLFGSCVTGSPFPGRGVIRPGVLHQSNSGYLVLEASWCLLNFPLWESVKASSRKRELGIPILYARPGIFMPETIAPVTMPYHANVIISGSRNELAVLSLVDPDLAGLVLDLPGTGPGGEPEKKADGKLPGPRAGRILHPSAREEILSLCSLPLIQGGDLQGHLGKVLSAVEKAEGQPVTDLHVRQALRELHPDLARMAEEAAPRRCKLRRSPGEAARCGPEGIILPIKLYPGKVITYGKQT